MKQKVENKIRELVPELMEKSRGCQFHNPNEIEWAQTVTLLCYNEKNGLYHFSEPDGSVFNCYQKTVDTFEIIGHPIHLEHYLQALGGNGYRWYLEWSGVCELYQEGLDKVVIRFNLKTGQPVTEEDYKFLAEVLDIEQSLSELSK